MAVGVARHVWACLKWSEIRFLLKAHRHVNWPKNLTYSFWTPSFAKVVLGIWPRLSVCLPLRTYVHPSVRDEFFSETLWWIFVIFSMKTHYCNCRIFECVVWCLKYLDEWGKFGPRMIFDQSLKFTQYFRKFFPSSNAVLVKKKFLKVSVLKF